MIRVRLPYHLRNLAGTGSEVRLAVVAPVTQQTVLDALEAQYPMLRGTIRDQQSQKRRDFIRFFAAGEDLSHTAVDVELPASVIQGQEPFRIIGAMAGG